MANYFCLGNLQPWGGLGLTTGLLDADSLADALELIMLKGEDISLLAAWSDARRRAFETIVSPMSSRNKARCHEVDPNEPTTDPFFKVLLSPSDDERQKELGSMLDGWDTNMRHVLAICNGEKI